MYTREDTKKIKVGSSSIGGGSRIKIQSMTNTKTKDVEKTVAQIRQLEQAGCDIVRLGVPDMESAKALHAIKKKTSVPLVADIHFDYRLALESIAAGIDKLRINPGNIGSEDRIEKVVRAAKESRIPIRIGVNGGSLDQEIRRKHQEKITAEALVESAEKHIRILEAHSFSDIAVSMKASSVPLTIEAYRLFSQRFDYPTHIGVTEAGTLMKGTVKSSVGLGILLYLGIGDTLRVSLTADPVEEVQVAKSILTSLQLYGKPQVEFVSCPTCARCQIDLIKLAETIEKKVGFVDKNIKIAIMGCGVNGPGEAKDADIGIAGGDKKALLFKKGEIIGSYPEEEIVERLLLEIHKL
ncbi:MAG TPA: 4-hydroxy-3-methylbut-2-en-1-yl diphosphate synthase [Eubacteriaceae bacterium]|nr:4-hydroxy-3-methylbut-2-en-1-yl diphosphate synthase [Eubacteriaceae bacterium]